MKKILKIIWFIVGGLIFLWTLTFGIKMYTLHTFGVIGAALLFAVGLGAFIIYLTITFLFIIIKKIRKPKQQSSPA